MATSPVIKDIIGRSGTRDALRVRYLAYGDGDTPDPTWQFLQTQAKLEIPVLVQSDGAILQRDDDSLEYEELHEGIYAVTATYLDPDHPQLERDFGSWDLEYNFTAPSGHIDYAISQIGYAAPGKQLEDFDNAINVVKTGASMKIEGFNLSAPPESIRINLSLAKTTFIDYSYRNVVLNAAGHKNSDVFLGFQPGELLLVSISGSQSQGDTSKLSFGFAYIKNEPSGYEVAGIATGGKQGHDLAWVLWEDAPGNAGMKKAAAAVYIAQVWPAASFAALGIS